MKLVLHFVISPWELQISLVHIFSRFSIYLLSVPLTKLFNVCLCWSYPLNLTKSHFHIHRKCTRKNKTVSLRDLVTVHILRHHHYWSIMVEYYNSFTFPHVSQITHCWVYIGIFLCFNLLWEFHAVVWGKITSVMTLGSEPISYISKFNLRICAQTLNFFLSQYWFLIILK